MADATTVVGIDFACDGVRLAGVRTGSGGPRVIVTHRYRWPGAAWSEGTIGNATVVREGLRQAFVDTTLPTDRVVLGIGGEAFHQILEIPQMSDAELGEQIQGEAEQHVPHAIADLQLEYRRLADAEPGRMRVLLSGFARQRLEAHLAVAREAGLHPRAAELEVEALRRVIAASTESVAAGRCIAVVRASLDGARVVVLRDVEAVFERAIAASNPEDGATAVARSLDFFAARDETRVHALILTGPLRAQWEMQLRERACADVTTWQPGRLSCEVDVNADYATAIGLALPGPTTHAVGGPPVQAGLWTRLRRRLGAR